MTAYDIRYLFEDSILIGVVFAMMCGVALTRKGQIDFKWFWLSLSILALILYASTVGRWLARPLTARLRRVGNPNNYISERPHSFVGSHEMYYSQ